MDVKAKEKVRVKKIKDCKIKIVIIIKNLRK